MDEKFPGSFIVDRFGKGGTMGGGNKLPMNPTNATPDDLLRYFVHKNLAMGYWIVV
jgi:hypothetical protein